MTSEERKPSPSESIHGAIFSPRFKSVAAMAGWDEDSLLYASLIVDDTPERQLSHKKRTVFQFKTPPSTSSRKKRRAQSSPVVPVPIVALDLDDVESSKKETQKDTPKADKKEKEKEKEEDRLEEKNSGVSTSLPCMDKLREELSCAICLDVCFEPSTTPCGHSFCLKCLRFSASKCGKKCPKCRQLISNGRSCTVNTVLWNTIQLLFPQEVEAKKAAGALNSRESDRRRRIPEAAFYDNLRNGSSDDSELPRSEETSMRRRRSTQSRNDDPTASLERDIRRNIRAASRVSSRDTGARTGRAAPSQDEDAALALRLQREEFMGAVRGTSTIQSSTSTYNPINAHSTSTNSSLSLASRSTFDQSSTSTNPTSSNSSSSFSLARANLRAMASRAITLRVRRQF